MASRSNPVLAAMGAKHRDASDGGEEAHSIPFRVVIDFLEGTGRKQDAIAFAKGFIDQHFDSPQSSGWYVMPYEGGYAFEVQDGGSRRAYLPGVIETLTQDPQAVVAVPMARRVLEVKRTRGGNFTSILLPEGMEPTDETLIQAQPGPRLTPYKSNGIGLFATGLSIFGAGLLTFLVSLLAFVTVWVVQLDRGMPVNDASLVPLTYWDRLSTTSSADGFVSALRYENGRWEVDQGNRRPSEPRVSVPEIPPLAQDLRDVAADGVVTTVTPTTELSAEELLGLIPAQAQ